MTQKCFQTVILVMGWVWKGVHHYYFSLIECQFLELGEGGREGWKISGNLSSLNLRIQCQKSFSRQQSSVEQKHFQSLGDRWSPYCKQYLMQQH